LRVIRSAGPADAAAYLSGLNACFPGWGGEASYDWAFRRRVGGPEADMLVVERGGALLAGTAVTYRRVQRVGREPETVGCMTGSWTLPAARRQGWFKALTVASMEAVAARGCTFLVGWGAAANGSAATLLRMSSRVVETAYLGAPDSGKTEMRAEVVPDDVAAPIFQARPAPAGANRLVYSPDEWLGQMVRRPMPAEALRLPSGTVVVVGGGRGRDLLLDADSYQPEALIDAAAAASVRSRRRGKSLQLYSPDPEVLEIAKSRGFASTPGYFYVIDLGSGVPADSAPWSFCDGDRM
jgi:hypothetical protein